MQVNRSKGRLAVNYSALGRPVTADLGEAVWRSLYMWESKSSGLGDSGLDIEH